MGETIIDSSDSATAGAEAPRGKPGFAFLLVLLIFAFVGAATAGGVTVFVVLQPPSAEPSEQTAKFLPADTQVYFSLNLRPGAGQLTKFRDILERFREHPNFRDSEDDALDAIEDEIGIDLLEEVLPWLGPEIAVAVIDVVESATVAGAGGVPLVVAFLGTQDPDQSEAIIEDLLSYAEEVGDVGFEFDTYRGFSVYSQEEEEFFHVAVTDEYVLLSTDLDLLEETIDRIEEGDVSDSLFESERFQEARDAVPDPRFSMLYVDTESIWRDARRLLPSELRRQLRDLVDDFIPEWAALTGAFMERGVKLVVSIPTPAKALETPPTINSLAFAQLLPQDTMALLAFAFEPDLDPLRDQLEDLIIGDLDIDDLGPELYEGIADEFDLDISEETTFSDILDELLDRFDDAFGINLEKDVLDWMTGEISLALLPTDFRGLTTDPLGAAVELAALIQFDTDKRRNVVNVMEDLLGLLEDALELDSDGISYGGGEGAVFDLSEAFGTTAYQPGYLILDDHLIIASTEDALELAGDINDGQEDPLAEEPEYLRLLKEAPGTRNPLIYVNIREIIDAVVRTLDPDDREQFREEVEPFVGPLRALLATSDLREGISTFTLILTIE